MDQYDLSHSVIKGKETNSLSVFPAVLTDQKQVFELVFNAHLKGIVYPNDKNSVIIYLPTGYSKPVFFHGSQKEIFLSENNDNLMLGETIPILIFILHL